MSRGHEAAPAERPVLGWLLGWAVKALYRTLRVRTLGRAPVDALIARGEGYAYGFWHGQQFVLLGAHAGERCAIMVSLSRDGALQKEVCHAFGYAVVRGSSSRRGREALVELSKLAGQGWNPALALDGPRGPAEEAHPGLVVLARRHRLWLVPLAAAARRRWMLGTWDRTRIPWPFTRAVVVYGAPFRVEDLPDARGRESTEIARAELERRVREAAVIAEREVREG